MSVDVLCKANGVLLISSVDPRESPRIVLRDKSLSRLALLPHYSAFSPVLLIFDSDADDYV